MNQREVRDAENLTWTCVQAFAGVEGAAAEEAAARVESEHGTVPVVATPSGGEATVRLELDSGWLESMSDEELVAAIGEARKG